MISDAKPYRLLKNLLLRDFSTNSLKISSQISVGKASGIILVVYQKISSGILLGSPGRIFTEVLQEIPLQIRPDIFPVGFQRMP